jgi:hypothetical protein
MPLLLLALGAGSCATSTKMSYVWREPSYTPSPANKVLIIGIGDNRRRIDMFESLMAKEFQARGVAAVTGTALPFPAGGSEDQVREAVKSSGADLAITSRLVDSQVNTTETKASAYMPIVGYTGFYGYYSSAYLAASSPDYYSESRKYVVETNVYDVKTQKLVWAGRSQTADPTDTVDAVESFGRTVVSELAKAGMIH